MAKRNDKPLTGELQNPGKKKGKKQKGAGTKKYDRNRVKCATYRLRVGKPNGKGKPGNKRGRNKTQK